MPPLNKQTIPLQFSAGIETQADSKGNLAPSLLNLENAIFTHPGAINKRQGLTGVSGQVDQTDKTISQGQALGNFEDQLLLFDGARAYSKVEYQSKWQDKGKFSSAINDTFSVIKNNAEQINCDMATASGLDCYVWEDSRGGVRFSVLDSQTKNVVLKDMLLSATGAVPKVFALGDQFVLIFTSGPNIQVTRISTSNIHAAPTSFTVASDFNKAYAPTYDACVSGNVVYIVYSAQIAADVGAAMYAQPKTIKITATSFSYPTHMMGVAIGSPPNSNITLQGAPIIGCPVMVRICPILDTSTPQEASADPSALIIYLDSNGKLWAAKIKSSVVGSLSPVALSDSSILPRYTISDGTVTPNNYSGYVPINIITNFAFAWDGVPYTDQINIKLFIEEHAYDSTAGIEPILPIPQWVMKVDLGLVLHGEIIAAGQFTNLKMCKGVGIYSRPFLQDGTMNIVVSYDSELQSTYFLLNEDLNVICKMNKSVAGGARLAASVDRNDNLRYRFGGITTAIEGLIPAEVVQAGPNQKWQLATLEKGKLISQNNQLFSLLGVNSSTLDFISPYQFYSTELNENLYIVGGVLQNYDGNQIQEAGFNIYPENLTVSNTKMTVTILTVGDAAHAASSSFTVLAGNRYRAGDYFYISGAQPWQRFQVFYNVDGVSNQITPLTGFQAVEIRISSNMDSFTVGDLTINFLNSLGAFFAERKDPESTATVVVTNLSTGASDLVVNGTIGAGNIDEGARQYCAVWKYVDNKGRVHRSTPSVAIDASAHLGGSITVSVPVLDLTNKDSVILEVYRTEALGTAFHLCTSVTAPVSASRNLDASKQRVSIVDDLSDSDLLSRELLYTFGDVLSNDSPPSCSFITTFKNRLFVSGLDNRNLIQYSKTITPEDHDAAAGFNDALFIELAPDGGDIVALAPMDDKLIIFKESKIYLLTGDGPNNTGANSTFGDPVLVSTDTGCSSPNSIVLTPAGLMFKSPKGIYLLDRSLQVQYIGHAVDAYNGLTISSALLMPTKNEARFITDGKALIFNYNQNQWSTFTNYDGNDAALYQGRLMLLKADGRIYQEDDSLFVDTEVDGTQNYVSMLLETSNLSLVGILGFQRAYRLQILGEFKGPHQLVIEAAYDFSPDYTQSAAYVNDGNLYGDIGNFGTTHGGVFGGSYAPYLVEVHLKQQKCTAVRFRISDESSALNGPSTTTDGLTLSAFALQIGAKAGLRKIPATSRVGTS